MSSTLAADEACPACSEAERLAAAADCARLEAIGREAKLQPFWTRPAWPVAQAICSAAGVLASVVCVSAPVSGLVIAAAALLLALIDSTRFAVLRRLTPSRASQNVLSAPEAGAPQAAVTLILTAATDDRPASESRFLPTNLIAANAACIALVAACAALRIFGIDNLIVAIVQLVPTLLLLAGILALLRIGGADVSHDASAVDGVLELAERLGDDPPANLDVAVVLAGAGSAQGAGLRHWLRSRRRSGMRPADVAIIHFEPCSEGSPVWWERDGTVIATGLHPQLRQAAKIAASGEGVHATPRSGPDATGAGVARGDGWPAIAVGARDEDGKTGNSSEPGPATVDFAEALVRELDSSLSAEASDD